MKIEDVKNENIEFLERGLGNLMQHIKNIKDEFGLNVIVAINKYAHDTETEIKCLEEKLKQQNISMSLVEAWGNGGDGAKDLAQKVVELCEKDNNFKPIYNLDEPIKDKVLKVAKKIYGAQDVEFSEESLKNIEKIEELGYGNLPICIAKTQYSFSDDAKNLECIEPFNIHVQDVILKTGAQFVVALAGNIFTMPGLPKKPAAEQ